MDVYYDGCYRFVRTNLSRIGLWPDDDPNFRKIRKSFVASVLLTSLFIQVSGFLLLPFDMRLLYKFSIRTSPTAFCNSIYFWLMYNEKTLKKLFDCIRVEFQMRRTEERRVVKNYANNARNSILFFTYINIIIIIVTISPEILLMLKQTTSLNETRVRKYPLFVGYYEKCQSYYFVILVPFYVIILTETIVSIGSWNTYIHLVHHLCAMFRVAGYMLENAFSSEKRAKLKVDKNETRNALVRVIDYHNDCTRFLNEINVICEYTFLMQLFLAIIVLSVDVLYIADMKYLTKDYNELLLCTIFIFCHLFLLCSSCHFGQKVLDHSVNFYKKTYTFPWYVTPVKIQKMCLLIMARSEKPSYLSIGKVFVLSYELLVTVLNTSISYAMVFHSL